MATANNNQSITTGGSVVYDSTSTGSDAAYTCNTFMVAVKSSSSFGVLVNCLGLHAPGDFISIAPGEKQYFAEGSNAIHQVTIKGDAGTATGVTYGIVFRK